MDADRADYANGGVAANLAHGPAAEHRAAAAAGRYFRAAARRSDTPGARLEGGESLGGIRGAPAGIARLTVDGGAAPGELAEQIAGHAALCGIESRAVHARVSGRRS